MTILLIFAFISGLITIAAPCIWPILPIVLSSSSTGGRKKPLGVTLGIMASFTLFTLTLSYIVKIIPFDPNILRLFAVVVISFFGLMLLIPKLSQIFEAMVSRLSGKFAGNINQQQNTGFKSGFITGSALGIVWAPCAGPILATIATLAATQAVNFQVIIVTLVYVTGVGIPLFIFATLGSKIFNQSRVVNKYTGLVQQIFGGVMLLTALAIFTGFDKTLQVKLLNAIPSYGNFITLIESNDGVQRELDKLKGNNNISGSNSSRADNLNLKDLGQAPEFTGINNWLNSNPLTMEELKGKVVLIDFWTYSCINCIRTLPHVTGWYEKYNKDGFVVIGVHTPEFEFEKKTSNVENALKQYAINYPVAQDNDFKTWNAYSNRFWPAKYLIDSKGHVRYAHFGEGNYDKTETAIQKLLAESGKQVSENLLNITDQTPTTRQTPETYIGLSRMDTVTNRITNTGTQDFIAADKIPQNAISFGGTWEIQTEKSITKQNATLSLNFTANEVFVVITPPAKGTSVKVFLDGQLLSNDQAGEDVKDGILLLDTDRLYKIINLRGKPGQHILRLEFQDQNTEVYAFTFG